VTLSNHVIVGGKVEGEGEVILKDRVEAQGKVQSSGSMQLSGDVKIDGKVGSSGNLRLSGGVVRMGEKVTVSGEMQVDIGAEGIVKFCRL
jgi:predicted acyltransferase (DUF342 family)